MYLHIWGATAFLWLSAAMELTPDENKKWDAVAYKLEEFAKEHNGNLHVFQDMYLASF